MKYTSYWFCIICLNKKDCRMSKKYVIANTGGLVIYDEKKPQKYGETKQYIINVTDKMIPF